MTAEYTKKMADLAHRAAKYGMYIDITEPAPLLGVDGGPGGAGPFALRYAHFGDGDGYDCHIAGVNLELLEVQLEQLESEPDWCLCSTCGSTMKREQALQKAG